MQRLLPVGAGYRAHAVRRIAVIEGGTRSPLQRPVRELEPSFIDRPCARLGNASHWPRSRSGGLLTTRRRVAELSLNLRRIARLLVDRCSAAGKRDERCQERNGQVSLHG